MGGTTRRPLVALDVVGLTPRLLEHMPAVRAVADDGFAAELGTVLPAVTCSAQTTMLTGTLIRDHGIVGNGWYFRDLGEVLLWRQHDSAVRAEWMWGTARRLDPSSGRRTCSGGTPWERARGDGDPAARLPRRRAEESGFLRAARGPARPAGSERRATPHASNALRLCYASQWPVSWRGPTGRRRPGRETRAGVDEGRL
ncbi:alkaline phosphatase family protein [Blastococcus goldschmidtiae]|uniref:alkaline phosphatase family protein n=1 Tax=Blastococcus goldschmidtiae TaxID=3075546 RepID=UPI0037BE98BC